MTVLQKCVVCGQEPMIINKPFDMDELVARIVSLIRRYTRFNQKDGQTQRFEFDGLTIDFNSRSIVTINGEYELPPKEFDLLLFLAKNQGKILTKQQIYEKYGAKNMCMMIVILWQSLAVCGKK